MSDLLAAAGTRMRAQARLVAIHAAGFLDHRPDALHDLRVAMRRLRALLRAFQDVLPGFPASELEQRLDRTIESVGAARDAEVWVALLAGRKIPRTVRSRRGWKPFVAFQRSEARAEAARARSVLASPAARSLLADLDDLLSDRRLRELVRPAPAQPVAALGVRVILAGLERVERRARVQPRFEPESVHRLRIACRRTRYDAEAFAAELGEPVEELARRLKRLQDVLGNIHDLDLHLAAARASAVRPPPGLAAELKRRRQAEAARFERAWGRLQAPGFRRRLANRLQTA